MTNARTTKRALLLSVVSLIVCFTMLLGTTYAWFTDSVTSAGNIIKSGTLDIEMYWADGKEDPATATWTDASTGAIFNNDKWEPGYAEVRHIKIKNEGTLALKYALSIAANGEVSKLADVIDVYYADPAVQVADRAALAAQTPMSNLTDALAGMATTANGTLLKDEEVIVTIALKMQETAGNEYQNLSIGSDFSIVLMATQKNYEKDSFDHNYDDIEIPDMDVQTINGVTYGATTDGDYVMISVDDDTLTSFTVDNKVTVLGTGGGFIDTYDRVFGKNTTLESITLPEGLVKINNNALNNATHLTSVNFPSTLETIGEASFRLTAMSELTIPANVETIGHGAFRDMPNLTTATIEGNAVLDNYVFRGCPNLTSIYLLGDDVTFVGGGQFACNKTTGDASKITIYVKNATVAARVYAAQTSAYGYEVKILGDATDGSDAQTVPQIKDQTTLNTAIANGGAVVLSAGQYKMPSSNTTGTVNIVGTTGTVLDVTKGAYMDNANVTIEGVTIKTSTGYVMDDNGNKGSDYAALYSPNTTYVNCTFDGPMRLGRDGAKFINCTFNNLGNDYVWTYGNEVSFEGCTFNTDGKAILIYSDGNGVVPAVSVKNCVFNATAGAKAGAISNQNCAAIEIHNYGCGVNLTTSGNTYNSNFSGEWRIKTYENIAENKIYVNGTEYTTIALDGKVMTMGAGNQVTVVG